MKLILKQKAEEIAAAAQAVMAHTHDWQVIEQYMCNRLADVQLTTTQQDKLDRYQYIYNARVSGKYLSKDIVSQLTRNYGVSLPQAYLDMKAAEELFTTVININKRFDYSVMLQLNSDYQRKCVELGDMKSLAKFEKNRIEINKEIEEIEDNRGELFEGHTFEMTFDPTLLGAAPISKDDMKGLLDAINAKRNKKIKTDMFEELNYTDSPADGS
jgi:hypothetical protein